MKSLVSLSFTRLAQAKMAEFTQNVIYKMTNDPQFSDLASQVAVLKNRYEAYQTAAALALNGGRLTTIEKDAKLNDMKSELTLIARLVDIQAVGDEAVILAAGYAVRRKPTSVTELSAPTNGQGFNLTSKGMAKLTWNHVAGASMYAIERRKKGEESWLNGDYCASRSKVFDKIDPNSEMEFKVRAISETGIKSDWSQVIEVFVS